MSRKFKTMITVQSVHVFISFAVSAHLPAFIEAWRTVDLQERLKLGSSGKLVPAQCA